MASQLKQAERDVIAQRRAAGVSNKAIAIELHRHERTISRETRRNSIAGIYCPAQAQKLAARRRLPAMYISSQAVRDGGLMAYGANLLDLRRRAATYVDKILKGTHPVDLPVKQPMRFDFVVNLRTARDLGITFPNEIMLQVTEVIQ